MKKIGYIFLAFVLCGCTQPKQEDTNKNQIYTDGTYDVIGSDGESVLKNCKTMASAKRWVTMNLL